MHEYVDVGQSGAKDSGFASSFSLGSFSLMEISASPLSNLPMVITLKADAMVTRLHALSEKKTASQRGCSLTRRYHSAGAEWAARRPIVKHFRNGKRRDAIPCSCGYDHFFVKRIENNSNVPPPRPTGAAILKGRSVLTPFSGIFQISILPLVYVINRDFGA